ncbi:MAG: arginine repressor [Clostridia bacterium]|nr:arginine repressor [Clostridia bacterium]
MKVKEKRQAQILKLISSTEVETQEEITLYLQNLGFKVTQATVSRDIKDLNLIKTSGVQKRYKYMASDQISTDIPDRKDRFTALVRDGVIDVRTAQQIVVIRCHSGMAQAVAAVIDGVDHPEIIGSIAGDDTIFLAAESLDAAVALQNEFRQIIKQS